jgi:phosphoribosylformimino-5-aminoimidazole carboxamide ribonucleotide (ProFAR) isomerase
MTADVAGDLSAAGGVAHQRDVSQVERLDHGCEIVSVGMGTNAP